MKKPRHDWATRKLPPVTIEEIDRHLDFIANLMARSSREDADLCLPIYRRLLRERNARRDADTLIADALARAAAQAPGRMAMQS